jgi:hypothetical protein
MATLATGACRYFMPQKPPALETDTAEESVDEG